MSVAKQTRLNLSRRARAESGAVVPRKAFGNAAGLLRIAAFDGNGVGRIDTLRGLLYRENSHAAANRRSCPHCRGKAHTIEPVIYAHADALADVNRLGEQMAEQRKSQKAVSHRAAVGRFTRRALGVYVNPLPVFNRVGEFLNAVLCYDEPIRRRRFAAFKFFQLA
jgi:hypothetical protein